MKLASGEYRSLCRPARTTVNHAWSKGVTSENTEIVNYNIFVVRDYLVYIVLFEHHSIIPNINDNFKLAIEPARNCLHKESQYCQRRIRTIDDY